MTPKEAAEVLRQEMSEATEKFGTFAGWSPRIWAIRTILTKGYAPEGFAVVPREPTEDAVAFLNKIEGAGYGGMADFECLRKSLQDALKKAKET